MGSPLQDKPGSTLTRSDWIVFGAGLLAYIFGFILLGRNHPDLAPFVIVGGIVAMLWAFLI